ncbi:YvrJ family protein [Paenibacillus shunpengii]|uniref:YvrJ family protein n=1 Tax=Paenibacillus shunpengii TaxID=2054424 RepID=A0ABW5SH14_9BACL|nr:MULTISPECIES: YvrJ family protein [unclassified Paenibacillus]OMC72211.1 hypothetical protein BK126_09480 [Paenibacillus sp. FSL H7-0326]SDX45096.1 hypothetical protein SAMN05518848_107231 [Paenibacillus sp. PDC88]
MELINLEEIIYLVTNIGFPMAVCVILLRYILSTIGTRLDKLDNSITRLTKTVRDLDAEAKAATNSQAIKTDRDKEGG